MKIAVFGATGGTGKNVVTVALAKGHDVVAVARRPEAITEKHEKLTIAKADVHDADAVSAALAGVDAVVLAIGPSSNSKPGDVISSAAKNVVTGCAKHGVKRIVLESGIMVSDGAELSLVSRALVAIFRTLLGALYRDKVIAESAVKNSGVEWVIVRPPNLNHGDAKGDYLAAPAAKISPPKAIAHADCADCLVRAATGEPAWVGHVVNVGYP